MEQQQRSSGLSGLQITGIVLLSMLVTMVATLFIVKIWFFPTPFTPVVLSPVEESQLEVKLAQFGRFANPNHPSSSLPKRANPPSSAGEPQPEVYSEEGASREIRLSEREINALVAKNTDLASKMAIDLSEDLVSLKMLIPLDPDFPFIGGQTLKVRAGVEIAYRQGLPVFILRGVSVMGVPLPNAWMAGLKNIDMVKVFGSEPGFWRSFADGVASIQVREGTLRIVLNE
ncbi:MAG: arginine N-succinyltransferase [Desulforhopalus sp.]|nr:arginine N-succinyltransferase [Desulforhopalus sp.]